MAVSVTLTPFSNAITAHVSGLDTTYVYDRLFVWSLDGEEFDSEIVEPGQESHTFTLSPIYFASDHSVALDIYSTETDRLLFSTIEYTSTLYADIPLWSWESSGQRRTAYQTATTQGFVSDYNHNVWDDFVRLIKLALDEVGLPWLNTYGSYNNTLVGEQYGALTAQRFNAVVQNIRYPYWSWEVDPEAHGYIGRQLVRRGDTVYGNYLIELAKNLNVVLSIYNGTASTLERRVDESAVLSHSSYARARHSAPAVYYGRLGTLLNDTTPVALPRRLFDVNHELLLRDNTEAVSLHSAPARRREHIELQHVAGLLAQIWREFNVHYQLLLQNNTSLRADKSYVLRLDHELFLEPDVTLGYAPIYPLYADSTVSSTNEGLLASLPASNLYSPVLVHSLATANLRVYKQVKAYADYLVGVSINSTATTHKVVRATGYTQVSTDTVGTAKAVAPLYPVGTSRGTTSASGELQTDRPQYAVGHGTLVDSSAGSLSQGEPKRMHGRSSNIIDFAAYVKQSNPQRLVSSTPIGILMRGKLEFDGAGGDWDEPEVSGTALTIHQVKFAWKSYRRLQLDWFRSKETGSQSTSMAVSSNVVTFVSRGWIFSDKRGKLLTVKQVYSARKEDRKLTIDMPWTYPTQIGDELILGCTTSRFMSKDRLQIDWLKTAELGTRTDLSASEDAKTFLSGGWVFADQRNAIVNVHQTLSAQLSNDNVDVDF